ncbi:MAG TPA: hypothetical protein VF411_04985 [Bacteroidia bacterium]
MNTVLKARNSGVRAFTYQDADKIKSSPVVSKDIVGNFADVYEEQDWLSNEFLQSMASTINEMEFAYLGDAEKIKKMIYTYFEASQRLLKARMDGIIDLKTEKKCAHEQWTESWIEQTNHIRKDTARATSDESRNEKHNLSWVGEWISQTIPEPEVVCYL